MYLRAEDVAFIDKTTSEKFGIDVLSLMERAGTSILPYINQDNVTILCGTGNNGGDGLVTGRHLINMGITTKIFIAGDIHKGTTCFKENYKKLVDIGYTPEVITNSVDNFLNHIKSTNIIVDCLYGVGLKGPVRPLGSRVIQAVNNSNSYIISVDIPSGMECNTDIKSGSSIIKANITLTFVANKLAFSYPNSTKYTGLVHIIDIGIPNEVLSMIK
ncbi:MAG: NAD(P)H-hydrate epimerase [Clostridium sp.]